MMQVLAVRPIRRFVLGACACLLVGAPALSLPALAHQATPATPATVPAPPQTVPTRPATSPAAPAPVAQPTPRSLQGGSQRVQGYYQQPVTAPQKPANPLPARAGSAAPATAPNLQGARFQLHRVIFSPSAFLTTPELDAAVAPFIGKEVGQGDIARLLDAVNALYVKHKVTTARAMLEPGVIKDGVLHVRLVEGKLGKLEIKGPKDVRDSFIRERLRLSPGDVVDAGALRDKLAYINRTTSLRLRALLEPGQAFGQTNVVVDAATPDRHTFNLFVDDNGVESTGRMREGIDVHLYSLLASDDMLAVDAVHSTGANDGVVAYSVPLTLSNGRLSVQFARSQINVVNGAFQNIDITGRSTTGSVGYTQPFVATVHWLFSGIGQYAVEDSKTSIVGQGIADTRTRQAVLGASLEYQRDGEAWGITQLVSRLHSDEPMLGKDSFVIAPGSAFWIRRLWSRPWALRIDLGWQLSSGKNIPSANLFQIGGLGSVRGYERGILSGPRGYYADFELHRSFGDNLDVFGFVDHGTIYAFYPGSKSVTGFGAGMFYNHGGWLTVAADVARPVQTIIPDQSGVRIDARVTFHWR